MRLACCCTASAALLSAACGMNFDVFDPVEGSADASIPSEAGHDAAAGGEGAVGTDAATMDGAACTGTSAACGATCVPSCASCDGGTDYVTCLVCADGGPPVLVCGPADPSGFCLDGNYGHCPCQQDSDCKAGNQRCTSNQCTACGEPLFDQNHTRCASNGNCCKTGATLGQCSC